MNQSNVVINKDFFFGHLEKTISKAPSGKSVVVDYNGTDTISFKVAGDTVYRTNSISQDFAKEVESYLKEKNVFSFRRFKISPYAFEAYFRKPKV